MIGSAPIHWFEQVDSTSEELKRRARRGALEPVWIAARQQIAGRGRLGRNWVSPEGNLFVSLLCPLAEGVSAATRVPFATGLAVRDACISVLPETDFRLKWPNDVRVDKAKLAGILVESGQTDSTFWVIIGIGVNVQVAPDNTGQASISLVDLGAPPETSPDEVLLALRTALARRLRQAETGFDGVLRDWSMSAEGLGQMVEAGPANARQKGRFEGVSEDGGMILRLPDGQTHIIRAGDVDLIGDV